MTVSLERACPRAASNRSSKSKTVADFLAHGRQYGTSDGWYLANGDLAPCAINKGLDVAQRIIYSSRFLHFSLWGNSAQVARFDRY